MGDVYLSLRELANGQVGIETNVVTVDCDDAPTWNISPDTGSVIFSGTDYVLEAEKNPGAAGGVKVSVTNNFRGS